MRHQPPTRRCRPSEEGYLLVAVIVLLALLILSLSVAVPRVRDDIQRDREVETMHRGKQYIRAIQLYYRKFGAYPPNVDALVKTSEIRFLRKRYIDPMTGKDDWKPVLFGQNKTPTAMGFFGQPIAGSSVAGTGPGGAAGIAGASSIGGAGSTLGSSLSTGIGSSGLGGLSSSPTGSATTTTSAGAAGSTSASSTSGGTSGQTFGGAGIIGFSPGSPRQSILIYKKKNHYNEWEFTYDPMSDQSQTTGNTGAIGQPASGISTGIGGGIGGGIGAPTGGAGIGGGIGTSPTTPITTSPQQ